MDWVFLNLFNLYKNIIIINNKMLLILGDIKFIFII